MGADYTATRWPSQRGQQDTPGARHQPHHRTRTRERAFKQKLTVWKRRVEVEHLANFPLLETEIQQAEDGLPQELRGQIIEHLKSLCETVQDNVGDVEEVEFA